MLCELAGLSPETRFSLLNLIQDILPDHTLLSTLERKLEEISDESLYDCHTYSPNTSPELTDRFLDLLLSDVVKMPTVVRSDGPGQDALADWKAGKLTISNYNK